MNRFLKHACFLFSDSQNAANLSAAAILFAPSLVSANSCYLIYNGNDGSNLWPLEYHYIASRALSAA
jgi:hypothetical protein